jgi:hypothetical protein
MSDDFFSYRVSEKTSQRLKQKNSFGPPKEKSEQQGGASEFLCLKRVVFIFGRPI